METIEISAGSNVKLIVEISSEALFFSLIRLNGKKLAGNQKNKFVVDLGLIDSIDNSILSCRSGFEIVTGDSDQIYDNTIVNYSLSYNNTKDVYDGVKARYNDDFFIALNKFKLKKK